MKTETPDLAQLVESIGALRAEVARLVDRVAALEAAAPAPRPTPAPAPAVAAPAAAADGEPLSDELILVISAAVAAFLGHRAHIRQIRLLGSAAWAQQGRMTIQASHRLAGRN